MKDHTRRRGGVKSSQSPDGKPPDPGEDKSWKVVVGPEFLDARVNPMGASARHLMLILDGSSRMNPFCWHCNATLSDLTGIEPRRIQLVLADLEKSGHISCVYSDPKKRHRLGIIMRRRVGPGTPAADTSERLAVVEQAVRAKWRPTEADPGRWMEKLGPHERKKVRSAHNAPTKENAHVERRKVRSPERNKVRQNNYVVVEKDEVKKEPASRDSASPSNDNDGSKTPEPKPSRREPRSCFEEGGGKELGAWVSASGDDAMKRAWQDWQACRPAGRVGDRLEAAMWFLVKMLREEFGNPFTPEQVDRAIEELNRAAAIEVQLAAGQSADDDLSDGQREFLEAIGPDLRLAFEALSPGKQREMLWPHSARFQAPLVAIQSREIRSVKPATITARATTFPAMVEALAEGDVTYAAGFAETLARDFGTEKDRDLWPALHSVAEQVWRGEVSVEDVLDAYRQAMGPEARNRGAVFTHALKAHGWRPG